MIKIVYKYIANIFKLSSSSPFKTQFVWINIGSKCFQFKG